MEPHYGRPENSEDYFAGWGEAVSIEIAFEYATIYAEQFHLNELSHYRRLTVNDLSPERFWSEYCWTVFASGFNAKVLTKKFDALMNAIGPWHWTHGENFVAPRILKVFGNHNKCTAIISCRKILLTLGWEQFKATYCSSAEDLGQLPYIGKITRYHIARNIGIDAIKPDLHLMRLANHFDSSDPESMCTFLSGLSGERIGVVDFILWAYCAAFGTKEIDHET